MILDDFDKEVIWADSTTGDSFRCVHVDYAMELKADIERLRAALSQIAAMGDEDNEWDAVDKFHNARSFAQRAVGQSGAST